MNDLAHKIAFGSSSQVIQSFCRFSLVRREDLEGASKTQRITRSRHELMYLLRQLTVLSYTDIGRHLGGRDMATVYAGISNVADRIGSDLEYRITMRDLMDAIIRSMASPAPSDDSDIVTRVAVSILQSPDLSDAEARQAALNILSRQLVLPQQVAHG